MKQYKLAVLAPHPVPYHVGIWRALAKSQIIESRVFYADTIGVTPVYVREFNTTIKWDVDLLSGYTYKFLKKTMLGFGQRSRLKLNITLPWELVRGRYDAVFIQDYMAISNIIALITAKIFGIQVIFRGEATLKDEQYQQGLKFRIKKVVVPLLFKLCDAVMYSCCGNKEFFKYYDTDERKMFPIPCAVDNDFFQNQRRKYIPSCNEIRQQLGISKDDFVVLFVGRMTVNKRPMDLIRALDSLKNDKIIILFLGDGVERKCMEAYCQENNINVRFVGFRNQSEIAKYYLVADVYTMISEYDYSPKSLNEAMNFALPIICSKSVGTALDMVKDGENGFLVDTGDINGIAERINYLFKNRDTARKMGLRSFEIVQRYNFTEDTVWIEKAVRFALNKNAKGSL